MPQCITRQAAAVQYYSALHREISSQGNIATNKKQRAWDIQISVWCEMPQCQQHRIAPKHFTAPSHWKSPPDAGAAPVLTVPSSSEYSPDQKLKVLLSNWYRRDFSNVSESMICPNSHGTCVVVLYTRLWKSQKETSNQLPIFWRGEIRRREVPHGKCSPATTEGKNKQRNPTGRQTLQSSCFLWSCKSTTKAQLPDPETELLAYSFLT